MSKLYKVEETLQTTLTHYVEVPDTMDKETFEQAVEDGLLYCQPVATPIYTETVGHEPVFAGTILATTVEHDHSHVEYCFSDPSPDEFLMAHQNHVMVSMDKSVRSLRERHLEGVLSGSENVKRLQSAVDSLSATMTAYDTAVKEAVGS